MLELLPNSALRRYEGHAAKGQERIRFSHPLFVFLIPRHFRSRLGTHLFRGLLDRRLENERFLARRLSGFGWIRHLIFALGSLLPLVDALTAKTVDSGAILNWVDES